METRFLQQKQEEKQNSLNMEEIKKEYSKIDRDWLFLHYQISFAIVLFAILCECVAGVLLFRYNMIAISEQKYFFKYAIVPSLANLACIAIESCVVKSKKISQTKKIYMVSLTYVAISFILFTVHSAYPALYYTFAGATMLTIIYARYRVTLITAVTGILAFIFSELCIEWDPEKASVFEDSSRLGNFYTTIFVLLAFSVVCLVTIRFEKERNQVSMQNSVERYQLWESVRTDDMTGIYNRKALHNAFKEMEENSKDLGYILAVVDIDHFKQINDCWGHHVGDRVLVSFAEVLRENCGLSTPYRYGGDEFCLLFCEVSMAEAVNTCNKIQCKLDALLFPGQPDLKLTASFGLAPYSLHMDAVRLFLNADYALYEAKKTRASIFVYEKDGELSGHFLE
ncbi:MAG: GGDEF domain-containing protein [Clostridium sp.]|uniref:GGDEF domain-containing protein n=1 Tax=Clostridium sp. TaxID=1506 RepID=UPI002911E8C6|nr:GGDEF domain-containing protein [Clostridium sp.]MDU7336699.1 GGDEF domain-containing protein [Clostridium sp.]